MAASEETAGEASDVERLFNHPRNGRVKFHPTQQCFYYQNTGVDVGGGEEFRLVGLTSILKQLFPVVINKTRSTEYAEQHPIRYKTVLASANRTVLQSVAGTCSPKCKGRDPIDHGNIVESEIAHYVEQDGRDVHEKYDIFCRTYAPDPCSCAIIRRCMQLGWTLLVSQFPLYDKRMRLGTAADFIACDRKGRLVLIELKASKNMGGDGGRYLSYETSRNTFTGPLKGIPASPHSEHQLQLMLMLIMIYMGHGVTIDKAYVVRVGYNRARKNSDVVFYGLEDWVWDHKADVYSYMTVYRDKTLSKKTLKRRSQHVDALPSSIAGAQKTRKRARRKKRSFRPENYRRSLQKVAAWIHHDHHQ